MTNSLDFKKQTDIDGMCFEVSTLDVVYVV
jgi:hypothetical protein